MSNLQEKKEDYILSLDNSRQLTKIDIIEQNLNAIDFGYELCQREYEEKLRWISVKEKLPEMNKTYPFEQKVLVKDINGDIEVSSYDHFDKDWSYLDGKITHWRYIL